MFKNLTAESHKRTHMADFKQTNDVESQTSLIKGISRQVSGSSTESFLGKQTGRTAVQSLNESTKGQSEIQRHEMNMTANDNSAGNISLPNKTTSQIEERLVKDDINNELYMPLSLTIVLKRKKEML